MRDSHRGFTIVKTGCGICLIRVQGHGAVMGTDYVSHSIGMDDGVTTLIAIDPWKVITKYFHLTLSQYMDTLAPVAVYHSLTVCAFDMAEVTVLVQHIYIT